jgi:hypothetical protein
MVDAALEIANKLNGPSGDHFAGNGWSSDFKANGAVRTDATASASTQTACFQK